MTARWRWSNRGINDRVAQDPAGRRPDARARAAGRRELPDHRLRHPRVRDRPRRRGGVRRSERPRRRRRRPALRHADGRARRAGRAEDLRRLLPARPHGRRARTTSGKSRINAAYSQRRRRRLVIDTLKANFDIDINHYLEVDFKSFQEIVDDDRQRHRVPPRAACATSRPGCYGPVRRRVLRARRRRGARVRARRGACEIADPNGDDRRPRDRRRTGGCSTSAPTSTASGASRTFIRKLAGLAISKSLSDPFLALSLADNVLGYISADQGLSRDDVNALVRAFRTVDVNDPNSVRFETLPVEHPDPTTRTSRWCPPPAPTR